MEEEDKSWILNEDEGDFFLYILDFYDGDFPTEIPMGFYFLDPSKAWDVYMDKYRKEGRWVSDSSEESMPKKLIVRKWKIIKSIELEYSPWYNKIEDIDRVYVNSYDDNDNIILTNPSSYIEEYTGMYIFDKQFSKPIDKEVLIGSEGKKDIYEIFSRGRRVGFYQTPSDIKGLPGNFNNFPAEIKMKIASELDVDDLISFCTSSKSHRELCGSADRSVWISKLKVLDSRVDISQIGDPFLYFLRMYYGVNILSMGALNRLYREPSNQKVNDRYRGRIDGKFLPIAKIKKKGFDLIADKCTRKMPDSPRSPRRSQEQIRNLLGSPPGSPRGQPVFRFGEFGYNDVDDFCTEQKYAVIVDAFRCALDPYETDICLIDRSGNLYLPSPYIDRLNKTLTMFGDNFNKLVLYEGVNDVKKFASNRYNAFFLTKDSNLTIRSFIEGMISSGSITGVKDIAGFGSYMIVLYKNGTVEIMTERGNLRPYNIDGVVTHIFATDTETFTALCDDGTVFHCNENDSEIKGVKFEPITITKIYSRINESDYNRQALIFIYLTADGILYYKYEDSSPKQIAENVKDVDVYEGEIGLLAVLNDGSVITINSPFEWQSYNQETGGPEYLKDRIIKIKRVNTGLKVIVNRFNAYILTINRAF